MNQFITIFSLLMLAHTAALFSSDKELKEAHAKLVVVTEEELQYKTTPSARLLFWRDDE